MQIGEFWADSEKPTIDGDWIRGLLVLGRESKNPVDTDGPRRGTSRVTRKFNTICESAAEYGKLDGCKAHIGPHRYDGKYPEADLMGSFHNPTTVPKGLRMDMLCRKVGESYHPQAAALRDHIEHNRAFGGFSPLFDGQSDVNTGEVQTIDAVSSIDWVLNPGSVKSITESEAGDGYAEMLGDHEKRIAECEASMTRHIAECHAPVKVGESIGVRTQPIPEVKTPDKTTLDPFAFVRGGTATK